MRVFLILSLMIALLVSAQKIVAEKTQDPSKQLVTGAYGDRVYVELDDLNDLYDRLYHVEVRVARLERGQ